MFRKTLPFAVIALIASSLLVAGCDTTKLQNLENDLDVRLSIPGLATTISAQFLDAATRQPITSRTSVTIGGKNGANVIDGIFFEPVRKVDVSSGLLSVGVGNEMSPSPANPLKINLFVSAPGYVETSKTVYADEKGHFNVQVFMVNEAAPPEGVATISKFAGQVDGSGRLTQAVTVVTPPESKTGGIAAVQIPAGTMMKTAGGAQLQGDVTATLTYYNNLTSSSLATFPGGFQNMSLQGQSGALQEDTSFLSGGFVSIDLKDSQGQRAALLSQGVTVTMSVPPETPNPDTGELVKSGDSIPLLSLEAQEGTWKNEGDVVFKAPAAGKLASIPAEFAGHPLVAQFTTQHLSWFNIDWTFPSIANCVRALAFGLNILGNDAHRALFLVASVAGFSIERYIGADLNPLFYNFPAILAGVTFILFHEGLEVGRATQVGPLCGNTLDVMVNVPPPPGNQPIVDLNATIEVVCPRGSSNFVILPDYDFWYRRAGTLVWIPVHVSAGLASLQGLVLGEDYEFRATYVDNGVEKTETRHFIASENQAGDSDFRVKSSTLTGNQLDIIFELFENRTICDNIG